MQIEIIGFNESQTYINKKVLDKENLLLIRYPNSYKKVIHEFNDFCFIQNEKDIKKDGFPFKLRISINADPNRSVKSNALMWKIYDVMSEALNLESGLLKSAERYTKENLYKTDMIEYGEKTTISVPEEMKYEIIEIAKTGHNNKLSGQLFKEEKNENPEYINLTFIRTSSYWTQSEMNFFIDMKLKELQTYRLNASLHSKTQMIIDEFTEFLKST